MKWKPSAFREPFKSYKVGEDATELRPDMGPHRGKTGPGTAAKSVRASGRKRGGSIAFRGASAGVSGGGIYGLGRGRRVVVKARYRTHLAVRRGGRQRVLAAHVRYLGRPNATKLERGVAFFGARNDALDAAGVPTGWARDRYHWRVILSPEEGDQLDLRRFVRDYAVRLESELETPLEWVGVTHHNTDHPHAHLLVRGVRAGGRDLTLPREVVSDRLREWAEELATRMLGERSEREADDYLNRLAAAQRRTQLDTLLLGMTTPPDPAKTLAEQTDSPWREVQVPRDWSPELAGRHHLERRLCVLADLGLAERTTQPFRRAKWRVRGDFVEQLDLLANHTAGQGRDAEQSAEVAGKSKGSQHRPNIRTQHYHPHDRQIRQEESPSRGKNLRNEVANDEHSMD